jgi:hypothetical protein
VDRKKYRTGIQKTIEILDKKIPKWRRLIDMDTLDMESCLNCVTGQIFGHYNRGLEELGIKDHYADEYGLVLVIDDDDSHYEDEYEELTDLWKEIMEQ